MRSDLPQVPQTSCQQTSCQKGTHRRPAVRHRTSCLSRGGTTLVAVFDACQQVLDHGHIGEGHHGPLEQCDMQPAPSTFLFDFYFCLNSFQDLSGKSPICHDVEQCWKLYWFCVSVEPHHPQVTATLHAFPQVWFWMDSPVCLHLTVMAESGCCGDEARTATILGRVPFAC